MESIIYIGVLCLSLAITVFLAAYTLSKADGKKTLWFMAMLAALFLYLLGSLLVTISATAGDAFNGTRVEYLGLGLLGPVTLFFVADYCEIAIRKKIKPLMLIVSLALITLLWMMPSHGLVYGPFEFTETVFFGLYATPNPVNFYLHVYVLLCILASAAMIVSRCFVWSTRHLPRLLLLLFTVLIPVVVDVLSAMDFMPLSDFGIQPMPIAMLLASMLLWLNIVRFNMFDIISEAMKMALRFTKEAFILIDSDNKLLHANESAIAIFPQLGHMKKGSAITRVKNWPFEKIDNKSIFTQIKFELKGDRYYAATIDAITDEDAKLLGNIILISNITEIVMSAKQAERSNKAKSDFLATMSHEIRTPLNAIIGIAEIQMRKEGMTDEDAAAYETIFTSSGHLLGIINDILDLSKIETGKMELSLADYDMPSLINDAVQLNIVRIGSMPIEFILDVDENLPATLYGDELRLKQILNNLLSNAIKYTQEGYVKLSIKHSAQGDFVTLYIAVEDTGQGMTAVQVERLFTEYLRFDNEANRATEGTGLGLTITKQLLDLMGGAIGVQSEYGKGSVFTVTLRQKSVGGGVIGPEVAEQLKSFTFVQDKQIAHHKIIVHPMPYGSALVVDDLEANLFVAQGFLSLYKLNVETAESGFEAIDKVQSGKTYDLIFMDYMMPGMDGIEATQKLRALGYKGAIVALTANALVGNDEMFASSGFDGFLTKPIDSLRFDEILNKFVRDRHPEEAEKYAPLTQGADLGAGLGADAPENGERGVDPKLIEVFIRSAKKSVATLREAAADGDLKLLAITAHAMKSALLNVGERGMSEDALALEKAGKSGDEYFITARLDDFIVSLEGLCERLGTQVAGVPESDPAFVGDGVLDVPQESGPAGTGDLSSGAPGASRSTLPLTEQFKILTKACEDYDINAAFAALDQLKGKAMGVDPAAIEKIRDMLFLDSDFDGAAERAKELLEKHQPLELAKHFLQNGT